MLRIQSVCHRTPLGVERIQRRVPDGIARLHSWPLRPLLSGSVVLARIEVKVNSREFEILYFTSAFNIEDSGKSGNSS